MMYIEPVCSCPISYATQLIAAHWKISAYLATEHTHRQTHTHARTLAHTHAQLTQ